MKNEKILLFDSKNSHILELLQKGIYVVALIEIILRLQNIEILYSDYTFIMKNPEAMFLGGMFSRLADINNQFLTYTALAVYTLCVAFNITTKRNALTKVMSWYLYGEINFFNSSIGDGGSGVILILMFYAIFLTKGKTLWQKQLNATLLFLIQTQVCFVYLNAGLLKVTGELWTKGVATYYALQVDQFSHPLLQEGFAKNALFVTVSSLGTLAYQLSFPYLVWMRPTKNLMIFIGSFIHLQIAFGMGLTTFGLIMSVSYFAFYQEEKAKSILSFPSRLKSILLKAKMGESLKITTQGHYS